ncbi:MAG: DUF3078 domain-containing protein [Bacteroidales bacterium]|nr:DUF3078 domain-containing protein [Bacteroidales bacterium]
MLRFRLMLSGMLVFPAAIAQLTPDSGSFVGDTVIADTVKIVSPAVFGPSANDSALVVPDTSFVIDTVPDVPVEFSAASASAYISSLLERDMFWRSSGDTMRLSLSRLVDHFSEPFDSVAGRLSRFEFDSVSLKEGDLVQNDTLPLRWLNDTSFIVDTVALVKDPLMLKEITVLEERDTLQVVFSDSINDIEFTYDSIVYEEVTYTETSIDSAYLDSLGLQLYQLVGEQEMPPFPYRGSLSAYRFLTDYEGVVRSDTMKVILADTVSPFYIVPSERTPDSLMTAVETLLDYTNKRDSILLYFSDMYGQATPFWLTTGRDDLYRYWVKNARNDSITIWIGNPSKQRVTMLLESDVDINRFEKEVADNIPIVRTRPELSLVSVEPLKKIPVYWDYQLSSSFAFNQTYLSNWSKGGESSVATVLDIKGEAKYKNTAAKTTWTNNGRLKYGSIITDEYGLRTNTDMLELNSQYNRVLEQKIDFSAVLYMKNQLARGYKYPNDSVVVSKFLNPMTFTLGLGVEYKPFKKTQLNFSILSYKNTMVLDTANIDQTIHGIEADKRVRQEMGGQLTIKNSISVWDDLKISNSVRLFSNYFNNPQNIDVDWEVSLDKRINWYASISLNMHFIYDDDIRFPVYDDNEEPVLLPDGSPKKSPKLQFKEFVGLTFSLSF